MLSLILFELYEMIIQTIRDTSTNIKEGSNNTLTDNLQLISRVTDI